MRPQSRALRLLAVVAALSAAVAVFAACDDSSDPLANRATVQAELLAPPNVPGPITRAPAHVVVNLQVVEKQVEIAPGVTYPVWTFNGSVPGPMIRVRVQDQVEIQLHNPDGSTVAHNIDLHAVNGPGGGAGATNVKPGEQAGFFFEAKAPGLYVYHCAAGIVADHIANGMYGAILVEPETGMSKVDHEYYVGQSELYTTGATGDTGLQELDMDKLLAEHPEYVVFDGNTKALQGNGALHSRTGETVRIYLANGGPNLVSSFHVIGEIFDKVYELGSLRAPNPIPDVQTVTVPAGGSAIVEFKTDVAGDYRLVDHSLSRVSKGALGILTVTGEYDTSIFRTASGAPAGDGHGGTPTATATAAPAGPLITGEGTINLRDNLFAPKDFRVQAGKQVVLDLPNRGKVPHNMRITGPDNAFDTGDDAVSVPELVKAGEDGKLTWQVPATTGTYKFRCDIHPVEMTGTITVE